MPEPFERRAPRGASRLARLIGSRSEPVRELEDLLARADRLRDVTPEQVREVAAHHGSDLEHSLLTARRALYRRFFEHCLVDQALSAEETAELEHLRGLLALSDADAAALHEQVAQSVYGRAIEQVLADHRLDPEEEEFLRRLGTELRLGEDERTRLYDEGERRSRQRFVARTLAHDHTFVSARERVLELQGTSADSLEQAILGALADATAAVPDLRHFEVTHIGGELAGGRVARWEVALHARLRASD